MRRRFSALQALELLRPEFDRYGITRVADQTGLDVVGIPCFAAIRPNSGTLSVNQGKGADGPAAQVSAIMEAVEFATAESPLGDRIVASIERLERGGHHWFVPRRSLPRGFVLDRELDCTWVQGHCLSTGKPVHVPLDSVALVPAASEALPFSQSSNGLAAGLGKSEAIVHALCELVERDAASLWSLRPFVHCSGTEIDLSGLPLSGNENAVAKVAAAGLRLKLFDLTTDIGVPVVMALVWTPKPLGYFDVASGVCAHPDPERAVEGAIHEAAQTRVSNIAGARDDIDPSEYNRPLPRWIAEMIGIDRRAGRPVPRAMEPRDFGGTPARVGGRMVVVPLSAPDDPVSVVKVLADTLEDRPTNVHWHPGSRATRAMSSL